METKEDSITSVIQAPWVWRGSNWLYNGRGTKSVQWVRMSVRLHASIVWERNLWEHQIPYASCYTRILREIPFPFPHTVPHAHVSCRRGRKGPHTRCFTCQDAVLRTTSLMWIDEWTGISHTVDYCVWIPHTQCVYTSAWLVGCVERQLAHLHMAFIHHEQASHLMKWGLLGWSKHVGNRVLGY